MINMKRYCFNKSESNGRYTKKRQMLRVQISEETVGSSNNQEQCAEMNIYSKKRR